MVVGCVSEALKICNNNKEKDMMYSKVKYTFVISFMEGSSFVEVGVNYREGVSR